MSDQTTTDEFVPPYISFAQLENVLERMRNEGVPARIDRSYLASWSGSAQAQFLKATQSLGLRDEHGRPTDTLKRLVTEVDERPAIIGDIVRAKYPGAVALGDDATQSQLEEVFREYPGISGSTTRKAITFYLHAAKFAGIPTSPFFKAARASSSGGSARTSRPRTTRRTGAPEDNGHDKKPASTQGALHPAILTLVQNLPRFPEDGTKPVFPDADRKAWFAYAKATFNLIFARPEGEDNAAGGEESEW